MQRLIALLVKSTILFLLLGYPAIVMAENGSIRGTVSLGVDEDGPVYGAYIRVYLVTEKIDIEFKDTPLQSGDFTRVTRLNHAHMDLYKTFLEKSRHTGYLVSDTDTSAEGTFEFKGIKPGDYYLLVTFPCIINGFKAAWQEPVHVGDGQITIVALNQENLFFPALKR